MVIDSGVVPFLVPLLSHQEVKVQVRVCFIKQFIEFTSHNFILSELISKVISRYFIALLCLQTADGSSEGSG